MRCQKRTFGCGTAAAMAAVLILSVAGPALAGNTVATVSGGGTAAFDPGEELEGETTQFAVGAIVSDVPVPNDIDPLLDGLGVGDFTVSDGNFFDATGEFNCSLAIEDVGFVMIIGHVSQGRVNGDGSITLCGLADIPIDTFSGGAFFDCPFAVTFRADGSGFTYYDVITGPAGDAETVVHGNINVH